MNKTELVAKIAEGAGLSKVDAKKALEATLEAIKKAVKKSEKVALVGFGTFDVTKRKARKGINPATKKAITIPAKKVVKFKAGKNTPLEAEIGGKNFLSFRRSKEFIDGIHVALAGNANYATISISVVQTAQQRILLVGLFEVSSRSSC